MQYEMSNKNSQIRRFYSELIFIGPIKWVMYTYFVKVITYNLKLIIFYNPRVRTYNLKELIFYNHKVITS